MLSMALAGALVISIAVAVAVLLRGMKGVAVLVPISLVGSCRARQPDLQARHRAGIGQRGRLLVSDEALGWAPDPRWAQHAREMSWPADEVLSIEPWRSYLQLGLLVRLHDGGRCGFILHNRDARAEALEWSARLGAGEGLA